jgi:hypothetical protein
MKKALIFASLSLLPSAAFAGNSSGWGGRAIEARILQETVDLNGQTNLELKLTPKEMLEALQSGLVQKPIVIKRPGIEPIKLTPSQFNFKLKTVELVTDEGQTIVGKELLNRIEDTESAVNPATIE